MKKILISLAIVAAVGTIAIGATTAFFSDTETSSGNTFTAGSLDLKVDNECHYYQDIGNGYEDVGCPEDPLNPEMLTTWSEADLVPGVHKFFWFDDVKPGDYGEDTVSLHVYDNDAWGRILVTPDPEMNLDNTCTEPEIGDEPNCDPAGEGELGENLLFWVWLDQGMEPGFQGEGDEYEGDNVWQGEYEPILITAGTIDPLGEEWSIAEGLAAAYVPGYEEYGLNQDGHMTGSITYYFGIGWELPSEVINDVQTDSFGGDLTIEIEQYRNNTTYPWTS